MIFTCKLWILSAIVLMTLILNVNCRATVKKDRVVDTKLSEENPGSQDYDHDAFMGQGHGHDTDELSPEDAKDVLRYIQL